MIGAGRPSDRFDQRLVSAGLHNRSPTASIASRRPTWPSATGPRESTFGQS